MTKTLGEGQFGAVFLARDTKEGNTFYAVKQVNKIKVNKSELLKRLFHTEVEVMKKIKHPNLLHLYDFLETNSNYYLVTQYCADGDLKSYVKKKGHLTETEAIYFLKQIMSGFTELHSKKIMHRDFKMANIFLHQGKIIIGDFGFAKHGVEMTKTKLGTPYNMAPELLFSTGQTFYNSLMDIWSIGVVYYQLLFSGKVPFNGNNIQELKKKVVNNSGRNLKFPNYAPISDLSKDLLRRLLEPKVKHRIKWKEFFNHPIFQRESMKSHVPVYNSLMHTSQVFDERNINEDNLSPKQRARQVQNTFEKDKKRIGMLSEVLVLPDPINLNIQDERITYGGGKIFNNSLKRDAVETNNNFFAHERNKHLLLFQTAKRARELTKNFKFSEKHNLFLTCCLALVKKGLMLISNNINILNNKINLYNLADFDDYCASKYGNRSMESFLTDRKIFSEYYSHINNVIDTRKTGKIELPSMISNQVKVDNINKSTGFDGCFEQLSDIKGVLSSQRHSNTQNFRKQGSIGSNYNMSSPKNRVYSNMNHNPNNYRGLGGANQGSNVDNKFDDEILEKIRKHNPRLPVINGVIEKVLINIYHYFRANTAKFQHSEQRNMLLFMNYCHYVLDLDRYFPFYCDDLSEYNTGYKHYYTPQMSNHHSQPANLRASASYTMQGKEYEHFESGLTGVIERKKKYETGVFDWDGYFKNVERANFGDLEAELVQYGLKEDSLSKIHFLIFLENDQGCFNMAALKNIQCFSGKF